MKKFTVKLIPGDGIGVDVIHEAVRVLEALARKHGGIAFDFQNLEWSCEYYLRTGRMMPSDGLKIRLTAMPFCWERWVSPVFRTTFLCANSSCRYGWGLTSM